MTARVNTDTRIVFVDELLKLGILMNDIYQEITIWKCFDKKTAIRYRGLFNINTRKYGVQSADFYRLPLEEKQLLQFENQFVGLFLEVSPEERCDWFDSIEEAIKAHEKEFS